MQVINILCHDGDIVLSLYVCNEVVSLTRLYVLVLHSQHIIERIDMVGACEPAVVACHFHNGIALP